MHMKKPHQSTGPYLVSNADVAYKMLFGATSVTQVADLI